MQKWIYYVKSLAYIHWCLVVFLVYIFVTEGSFLASAVTGF